MNGNDFLEKKGMNTVMYCDFILAIKESKLF